MSNTRLDLLTLSVKASFSFYKKNGFQVTHSKVNFYLLKDHGLDDQFPLFQFLLAKGIVPRHTFNFPGLEGRWLRFAVRTTEENKQLLEAMQEWRSHFPSIIFITGGVRSGREALPED